MIKMFTTCFLCLQSVIIVTVAFHDFIFVVMYNVVVFFFFFVDEDCGRREKTLHFWMRVILERVDLWL